MQRGWSCDNNRASGRQIGCRMLPEHERNGAIAQLGERLHGMQEVSGSIPLGSTNFFNNLDHSLAIVDQMVALYVSTM